jgi:hypothetical protein
MPYTAEEKAISDGYRNDFNRRISTMIVENNDKYHKWKNSGRLVVMPHDSVAIELGRTLRLRATASTGENILCSRIFIYSDSRLITDYIVPVTSFVVVADPPISRYTTLELRDRQNSMYPPTR